MFRIVDFINQNAWAMYLGGSVGVFFPITNFRFWIIIVPTILLVSWKEFREKNSIVIKYK